MKIDFVIVNNNFMYNYNKKFILESEYYLDS